MPFKAKRSATPYLVLAVGILFTFIVCYHLSRVTEDEDKERFSGLVQQIHSNINSRMETYTALVRAQTGLFAASENVQPAEFKSFVNTLELPAHYPGIFGIGYAERTKPEERERLIQSKRRSGSGSFQIWPEATRDEYYPVLHFEPFERNSKTIGYDMYADPIRREAMEKARDSGLPAVTGRMTLVYDMDRPSQKPGFVICAPIYRKGHSIKNEVERREALVGFIYSPFRTDDFLKDIVGNDVLNEVRFEIHDGSEPRAENFLYSSAASAAAPSLNEGEPRFIATTKLPIADNRMWMLTFASRPRFDLSHEKNWVPYTFVGGVLISLLFFGVIRSQIQSRTSAEEVAAELRESEATVRKTLADRERAEFAFKEGEERYHDLVENANDIVYTLDMNGRLTSVNRAAEIITGYPREELLNMKLTDIMTPESAMTAARMFECKASGGGQRTNYELDIRSKDGNVITLEINSKVVLKDGEVAGTQGVARDITTRRRAEQALREADQRALSEYERLLERISSLAQALGAARELVTIFRALRDFTLVSVPCDGLFISLYDPVRDVRTACYAWGDGQEFDTSDLPPMPVNASGPNSRAVRTGQVIITDDFMNIQRSHPVVIVGPDNSLRPQSSMAVPMSVMGRIVGTIEIQSYERGAYVDEHATAMRMAANLTAVAIENVRLLDRESTARATAEESNRLKDEFLATVSHELRTPLTAILGWSRMLESSSISDPMAGRALETIRRNAKAQAQIIDDILDVSRIITGKLYLELHPIELAPVLDAAVNVVRPTGEAKNIQILVQIEPKPMVVTGDSNRLQQVIWNLLSNAIKFTPSGGRVSLTAADVGSQIEIRVTDTGQGIMRDFLPFVFDRFRQADSTTTREHGGLGLGLAIARHLVEIHGGTIKADSAGEGKGSTFSVRLPSVGPAGPGRLPAREDSSAGFVADSRLHGIHVLLVDDDVDTLDLLGEALRQQKAIVTKACSVSDALEALKISKPDIVVSDIAMPGEDGFQLIKRIRAMNSNNEQFIPALAITAYAKLEDREAALSSGYQSYLAKPIELSEFITAVAEAVFGNGDKTE
ncbi:MAG TPA: CHASE domain-containing protein [Pyrinomonadaceae bacterium]|nr:CHASE domain-containing protein [Pyrinomonadaceae bacterium]